MRSAASFVYVLVYVTAQSIAIAQQTSTFGAAVDFKTLRRSRELVGGDFNGDGLQDVAVVGEAGISVYTQTADPMGIRSSITASPIPRGETRSASLNGDRFADLVVLTSDPPVLHALTGKGDGTFTERWTKQLEDREYKFTLGDITNDGRTDIIVYSRKDPGAMVFAGNGAGGFKPPLSILTDVPFAELLIRDCNDDKLNDVIGVNWISNEVDVFVSFGRVKFGNPSVLSFAQEPRMIMTAYLDEGNTLDLLVAIGGERSLRVYHGDGYGGFVPATAVQLDASASKVAVAAVNGTGRPDLICLTADDPHLEVWTNGADGLYEDRSEFFAGKSPSDLLVAPAGSDKSSGSIAALLDPASSKLRILLPSAARPRKAEDKNYCTGVSPSGLAKVDINRDGLSDFAVANSGSMGYSIYLNNGKGGLEGQLFFPVVMNPTRISGFSREDSSTVILVGGKFEDKSLVSVFSPELVNTSSTSISTQQDPGFLGITHSAKLGYADVFVQEFERSTQRISLTKFEQVSPRRFAERSFNPSTPLIASAVSSVSGSRSDLVFLMTYDARRKHCYVYRSMAMDSKRTNLVSVLTIAADTKPSALMWTADVNRDGRPDLLINLRRPDNTLLVALAGGDSTFAAPIPLISDEVSVADRAGLQIADMNHDGLQDLILDNELDKSIQAYLGKGEGEFSQKIRLMSSVGIGGFDAVDMDGDGYPELVLVDTNEGLLKIIHVNK